MLIRNIKTTNHLIKFYFERTSENEAFLKEKLIYLPKTQLNWKPALNVWSIGECIRHLIASHKAYQSKFNFALTREKKDYPYKYSLIGRLIIRSVDPVNIRKTKTLKIFKPDSSNIDENIFGEFFNVQNQTTSFVEKMEGMNMAKIKISSPANIFLRINLGDPLIILPLHDTRHLNQAIRVKESSGFPSSKFIYNNNQ